MSRLGKAGVDYVEARSRAMYVHLKERKNAKTPPRFQAATGNALDDMQGFLSTLRNYVVRLEEKAAEYEKARVKASVQKTTIARQDFGRILREAHFAIAREARKYETED